MDNEVYDIVVIGGGIQGAGVAQAAVAAGYKSALLEKTAIASATSSRSSKLIHGGLRYLESAQFSLVRKALLERELLLRIAPDLVNPVSFYIPVYKSTSRPAWKIRLGLMLYAILGGLKRYTFFRKINVDKMNQFKKLLAKDRIAVFQYRDAQTNDQELTNAVVKSAIELGMELFCPAEFSSAVDRHNYYKISFNQSNEKKQIKAGYIINAAGPWVNEVLNKIIPEPQSLGIELVQGAHIILDVKPLEGVFYLEAPQDQRAVFVMPWYGKTLVGTTETAFTGDLDNIQATAKEINYLLQVYQHYFPADAVKILDSFAGVRVLPETELSYFHRPRDTVLHQSARNVLTMYGGKLTGYRATAEQVLKKIKADLPVRQPVADTREIRLTKS